MKEYIYKYETHCHTKEVSRCGGSYVTELIDAYVKAGYSGMVITDHFFNGNCGVEEELEWKDKVTYFNKPYKIAKEYVDKYEGFSVFWGWEYNDKGTEFLTYGLDVNFLYDNPDLLSWSTEEYLDKVHEAGGFIIHAHPFRKRDYIKNPRYFPNQIDAVEIVNGGNYRENGQGFDDLAAEYAQKLGLPGTRGSDCHNVNVINGEGIVLNKRVNSFDELILAIKNNDFR